MKKMINLSIVLILALGAIISHAQIQAENSQVDYQKDVNGLYVKEEITQLQSNNPTLKFNMDFERSNLLSGELIKVYQIIPGKKNTKNHVIFRFDTAGKLISRYESLAYEDDQIVYGNIIHPAKENIKESQTDKNYSRANTYNVFKIDPTEGAQSTFSYSISQLTRDNSLLECETIEALYPQTHSSEEIVYDIDMITGDEAIQEKFAEIMCYHHLHSIDEYVKKQYTEYQILNSSAQNYPITAKVGFDPRDNTFGQTNFTFYPNSFDVLYPTNFNNKDHAEDGYMIRREYFRAYHNFLVDANQGFNDGIDRGIADYMAYSSMKDEIFNSPGNVMHRWANLFTLDINYDDIHSTTNSTTNSSQVLSTVLWFLHHFAIGEDRTTSLVFESLPLLNGFLEDQVAAAAEIYKTAISIPDFVNDQEKCLIASVLLYVYGEKFRLKLGDAGFDIDPLDLYIRDHFSDITGEQPTYNGSVLNSPDIWNRRQYDGQFGHQMSFWDVNQTGGQTDYLHVRINADMCAQLLADNFLNDLKVNVYYSLHSTGYVWEEDWNDDLPSQNVFGDLIGTFYFSDRTNNNLPTFRNAGGNIVQHGINFDLNNEAIILILPWTVPNLAGIPVNMSYRLNFGFLARIESAEVDPLEYYGSPDVEGANTYANIQNFNNVAHKNSLLLASIFAPWNGVDELKPVDAFVLSPCKFGDCNPDPDPTNPDPTVSIHLVPTEHEPDPGNDPGHDGITPPRPVFNDYFEFGQVQIVLDDDTFLEWTQNGSQGTGFLVNHDNEIEVISRDFVLEGIPRPRTNHTKLVGLKFVGNSSLDRTAFDVIQEDNLGEYMGGIHVEVRKGEQIGTRNQEVATDEISIYPNPVDGDILFVDQLTKGSNYIVIGVDGKQYMNGLIKEGQKSIDLSELGKGVYFIQFNKMDGNIVTKKLIKI